MGVGKGESITRSAHTKLQSTQPASLALSIQANPLILLSELQLHLKTQKRAGKCALLIYPFNIRFIILSDTHTHTHGPPPRLCLSHTTLHTHTLARKKKKKKTFLRQRDACLTPTVSGTVLFVVDARRCTFFFCVCYYLWRFSGSCSSLAGIRAESSPTPERHAGSGRV